MSQNVKFDFLKTELPTLIWRSRWNELAEKHGLPFKRGYLQNLDSIGKGPQKSHLRGRVVYQRTDLITWLNDFVSNSDIDDTNLKQEFLKQKSKP